MQVDERHLVPTAGLEPGCLRQFAVACLLLMCYLGKSFLVD
jgi:hypothetical protein